MKTCRRVFLVSIFLSICFVLFDQHQSIGTEPEGGKNDKKIVFQWAFCALQKADTGLRLSVINRKAALKSGDRIKFFLKLESPNFLYLIYQSSRREMRLLFPYRLKQLESPETMSGKHYIPKGQQWFVLDEHTGQEKYYLLASSNRLFDLEALINQYESAAIGKKSGLADQITSEIRNLRKRHLKFKTYAEKPVAPVGNLSGAEQSESGHSKDIAGYAVEISTTTFFSRTYTIDHQQE